MANERWRSEQGRDRQDEYGRGRDDRERRRDEGVSGERDDATGAFRDPGRGFYSGASETARGYGGYGGGGGDTRSGRFSDQRSDEGYGRDWQSRGDWSREDRRGGDFGERRRGRPYGGGFGGEGYGREGGFGRGGDTWRGDAWRGDAWRGDAWRGGAYSRSDYGRGGDYGRDANRGEERGFWERASDEVSSWFGDEDAERRRRLDERGEHRGRGPKGYTRSDERIREDVCDRLTDDPAIDASEVEIAVAGCEVTLSGTVDTREAKRRAEDLAERVSGVTHVQNNLRVQQTGWSGTADTGARTGTAGSSGARTGTTATSGTSFGDAATDTTGTRRQG